MTKRKGSSLIDCLVGLAIFVMIGQGLVAMSTQTTRSCRTLRSELIVKQLVMDWMDRLAAGEARALLDGRTALLEGGRLQEQLAPGTTIVLPEELQVQAILEFPVLPLDGERVRFARITCSARWREGAQTRNVSCSVLTDAL